MRDYSFSLAFVVGFSFRNSSMHNHDSSGVVEKGPAVGHGRQGEGKWDEVKNQTEGKEE